MPLRHRSALRRLRVPCALALLVAASRPAGAEPPAPEARAEALERYQRGRALHAEGAWDQALAEFLASRELYPGWQSLSGAALCLIQLGRLDEALELSEALLREHGDALKPDAKAAAQRRVDELRRQVGVLEVDGAEPGAAITVDGRRRGEAPLPSPLRVTSGSHLVRIFKAGFEPLEVRAEVAGGQLVRVEARLVPLARTGRLRIAEQGGRSLEVVVDGSAVARTPWEGLLPPGEHVVALRGEGRLGTPPVRIQVEVDRTTPLTLAAEELAAALRVEPVPVNASVAVDGVTLGRGIWEGRLRAGEHRVEIAAPGFLPESRRLGLARDQSEVLRVTLERDPSSPFWRKPARPPRWVVELSTGLVVIPTFGGDVAGACTGRCTQGLGGGGEAALHAGYELGAGLGFGITLGYLAAAQGVAGRRATLSPVGLPEARGTVDDRIALRGARIGGWIGLALRDGVPLRFRLGAGILAGSLLDSRSNASFVAADGSPYALGDLAQRHPALFFHVTPEVRVALRLGRRVELNAGVAAPLLVDLAAPRWDASQAVRAGSDGYGVPADDALTSQVILSIIPGVGVRYDL